MSPNVQKIEYMPKGPPLITYPLVIRMKGTNAVKILPDIKV
jgi:hypothetical protein